MSRKTEANSPMGASEDVDKQFTSLGYLHFLAGFCPRHQKLPSLWLSKLFIPAVNADCVRFFRNEEDQVCAALIWARLDSEAVERMLKNNELPRADDWARGKSLWFLDVLAPFHHGKLVARGEAVVINDQFGVRLTDIVTQTERVDILGGATSGGES